MTENQLLAILRYWKEKLKLQDWDISIEFVAREEMSEIDHVGECVAQLSDKTAHIKILRPSEKDSSHDVEISVVHECFHVLYCGAEPDGETEPKRALFENGVDTMARAMVDLRRGKRKPLPIVREDIIWGAGLFEGEGCISMYKEGGSYPLPRLTLTTTDYDTMVRFFFSVMGIGAVYGPRWGKKSTKPSWTWTVNGIETCQAILVMFWPWLGARRRGRALDVLSQYRGYIQKSDRKTTCSTEGCGSPSYNHKLCKKHYSKWRYENDKLIKVGLRERPQSIKRKLRYLAAVKSETTSENDLLKLRRKISDALGELTERERIVVTHYFGIDREKRLTFNTIGKMFQQEGFGIRHIKIRAIKKLSHAGITEVDLLVAGSVEFV